MDLTRLQELVSESLRDWFKKEDWVRIDTQGNITGPCGTMKKGGATTRCLPRKKAQSLSKAERAKTSRKKASASRQNIFKRDQYCCQYCGIDLNNKDATVDHVIPKCKGGSSTWINMVASCRACNLFKGSKTPKEAKMVLKNKPKEPSYGFLFESMLITFRKKK